MRLKSSRQNDYDTTFLQHLIMAKFSERL